jgi:hypothetical protein
MSPRVVIVKATEEHAAEMAPRMRRIDEIECVAAGAYTGRDGLEMSLASSAMAWTAVCDGEIVCMFGVGAARLVSDWGVPWLLGTDRIEGLAFRFLRTSMDYLERMEDVYPVLQNWVHEDNELAIRWLEWLGFDVGEPEPHGPNGAMFRPMLKGVS